jgi:hypothetical protein
LLDNLRVTDIVAEGVPKHVGESRQRDPAKWFGGFVPRSLREAQHNFREGNKLRARLRTVIMGQANIKRKHFDVKALHICLIHDVTFRLHSSSAGGGSS